MTFLHYAESKGRATSIRQTQVNLYQRPGLLQKNILDKGENLDGQMGGFLQIVIHRLMKFRISIFPFIMGISLPLLGEGINFEKEMERNAFTVTFSEFGLETCAKTPLGQ